MTPEIQKHFNSNYKRIRGRNFLAHGDSNFITVRFEARPPFHPPMNKEALLTTLSAPDTSINRTILDDQLRGILNQVTLMVRQMPTPKAALFVPDVKEGSSSVIDVMGEDDEASVSLQVAGQEYIFEQNNDRGLLLPKQGSTIAQLLGSTDLEKILPSDPDIIANQNLTGAQLRKSLPKFASNLKKLFQEKRLYENQESSQSSAKKPFSIITQMQDSKDTTLRLNVKEGQLDSLFISPTFDHKNDNTFFMLYPKSHNDIPIQ